MPSQRRTRRQSPGQQDDNTEDRRYDNPLPPCEGAKLLPFQGRYAPLHFKRLISDPVRDQKSHVFEVTIGSDVYALKVFRFFDDDDAAHDSDLYGSDQEAVPCDTLSHLDHYYAPFYNECRAFGKLIDADQNGKIAVHCHGYMSLPACWEGRLNKQFGKLDWDRLDEDSARPVSKRQDLMAIVKEMLHDNVPWTPKVARKCLKDLRRLRSLGVYPMDIKADNYVGGLLVDLSQAYTKPHLIFRIKPAHWLRMEQERDLADFDQMVEEMGLKTNFRAIVNYKYRYKLRLSTTTESPYYGKTRKKRKRDTRGDEGDDSMVSGDLTEKEDLGR
ncbi:MAG: hypothetical protein Q9183_004937 [Haloplaca sp. 2 TL-2023]